VGLKKEIRKKEKVMKKRLAVITAIVLAGCLQVQANLITIVNPSAEANKGAVPTGWTYYADGSFPGATAQTALSRPIAADDGLNIFVLYHAGLTQTLGSTYQSGFTYTMSVDAVKRGDTAYNTGYGFGLYYNNGGTLTEVAKTNGVANWANGTWQQKDLVLTVNAGAAYIGKDIVVKLFAAPTSGTSDFVDNVRLNSVPEPATIGMLGLGTLITVLIRRMRS
jgi:hypothetical protein